MSDTVEFLEELAKLDELKARIQKFSGTSPKNFENLEWLWEVEQTYHSNAIEGSTLSFEETKLILDRGMHPPGKSLREVLEAVNHREAMRYCRKLQVKRPQEISEDDLLGIHTQILRGILSEEAGIYRRVRVRVANSASIFPNPVKVPELTGEFFEWLKSTEEIHPVMVAGQAHLRLVSIHPFVDGNGRTARLLMNLILAQCGFAPANIQISKRTAYIDCLEKAQSGGGESDFLKFIIQQEKLGLETVLDTLENNIHWQ